MGRKSNFAPGVRERAVRLVLEQAASRASEWAAICSIAEKVGCMPETFRKWVRQAERDAGKRGGRTTADRNRLEELERENRGLRRANRQPDSAQGVGLFRTRGARPPTKVMVAFIEQYREGVPAVPSAVDLFAHVR